MSYSKKLDELKPTEIKNAYDRIERLRTDRNEKPDPVWLGRARHIGTMFDRENAGRRDARSRFNENASWALAQQLEALESQLVLEPTMPNVMTQILSNVSDISPGNDTYSYVPVQTEGVAKAIANYADDLPMVNMNVDKVSHAIKAYGAGFFYSFDDLEKAAFLNVSLPSDGARAAREAWDRKLDQVLALGDSAFGIPAGLANQSTGTGALQVRSTSIVSASAWTDAIDTTTAALMYADLSALVAEYHGEGEGLFAPTDLIMTPDHHARIKQARMPDDSKTVEKALLDSQPGLQIWSSSWFRNVDGADKHRMLLLNRAPMNAQTIIARPFSFSSPEQHNLSVKLLGYGKTGGVAIKRRISMRYLLLDLS